MDNVQVKCHHILLPFIVHGWHVKVPFEVCLFNCATFAFSIDNVLLLAVVVHGRHVVIVVVFYYFQRSRKIT